MPEQYYSPTAESSSLADDNERKVDIRDVDVTPHSFEDIMSEHTLPYDSEQVQARAYATPQVSPILPLSACPSPVRGQSGDDYLSARLAALHEEYPDAIVVLRNADKLGATPLMEQGDRYIISGADLCKIDIDESFPNVEPDVFCGECWTRYIDSEMLGENKEGVDSSIQYISCSGEKLFSEMFAWCDASDIVIADALPDMNNKSYDNYILSPRSLWEMEKGSYAADERADIRGESETDSSQATRDDIYFIKMYDSSTSFGSVITLATFDDDALAVSQLTGLPVDEHGMLEINSSRNEEEYAALLEAGIINKSVESSYDDTYRSYIVNAYNREIYRFEHYQSYTLAATDTISQDADKDLANKDYGVTIDSSRGYNLETIVKDEGDLCRQSAARAVEALDPSHVAGASLISDPDLSPSLSADVQAQLAYDTEPLDARITNPHITGGNVTDLFRSGLTLQERLSGVDVFVARIDGVRFVQPIPPDLAEAYHKGVITMSTLANSMLPIYDERQAVKAAASDQQRVLDEKREAAFSMLSGNFDKAYYDEMHSNDYSRGVR